MNWKKLLATTTIASLLLTSVPAALHAESIYSSQGIVIEQAYEQNAVEEQDASADEAVSASSVSFTFSSSGISASGADSGYSIDGSVLNIEANGTYTVSGQCSEGSIVVGKGLDSVTIVMNELTLSASKTAPVVVKKGSSVKIIVLGSNELTDEENPDDEEVSDDFEGAAIKVKSGSSLEITGTGTLICDGSACKNGIKGAATATVTINGSSLNVKAANSAIASDGKVVINGGKITVDSADDGIKAEPDEDDTDSEGVVEINGGEVTIKAAGDGLETSGDLLITGGTLEINSGDDAIHSNKDANITGGTLTITAEDDALHAEYNLNIGAEGASGPSITVNKCKEGFEGASINLISGQGAITADDDGINAANKDLGNYAFAINIAGGEWTVNAGGDGIDSNRNITISGGKTETFGSTNAGNSALDYDGSCTLTGGSLLAVGMSGMGQGVSSNNCLTFNNVTVTSGAAIQIKDASGNTVYSSTGRKQANQVVFASSSLTSGSTYTLYVNGKSVGAATATTGNSGMMPGGQGSGGMRPDWGGQGGQMPGQGGQGGQMSGQQNQGSGSMRPGWGGQGGQMPGQGGQISGQQNQGSGSMTPGQGGQMPGQQNQGSGSMTPGQSGQMPGQQNQGSSGMRPGRGGQGGQMPGQGGQMPGQDTQQNQGSGQTSQDSLRAFVERLYENVLGRKSDATGLANWIAALKNGKSATQVVYGFFNSVEFKNLGINNSTYLTKLYATLFNRQPDSTGYASWLKALNSGNTRTKILSGFCGSQEFAKLCQSYGINV